ncbi:MAG: ABC transporter substrate-binding protein, partial [Caldivirga sp.]
MSPRIKTYILLAIAAALALGVTITHAQQKPQIIQAIPGTLIYAPSGPNFNPYAPSNLIGTSTTFMPLAMYNQFTGVLYPILAENWTEFPQNKTLIIYLRHDLYWFNGSAVIPFTAWDVYAEFYIGVKAF